MARLATRLAYARDRLRAWRDRRAGRPPKTHVVICGYPRGGTSLLYNMLAASLEGFHYDEFEHVCLRYARDYRDTLSKRPLDVFQLEELVRQNRLGKRLLAIVLIRDLRDVITSRHPRAPDDYFIDYESCIRVDGPNGSDRAHPGIRAIAAEIERVGQLASLELVRVRYEDLVRDPDGVQSRLAARTGLPLRGRFSEFHRCAHLAYRYDGVRAARAPELVREERPVDASRAGKWRAPEHAERIREQFTRHPGLLELLVRYGYEPDASWLAAYGAGG